MKIFSSSLILLFLLTACSSETKINTVKVADKYSIDMPDYLTKTDDLNEDASLQYQNVIRECYAIVIDESKQELYDVIAASEELDDYPQSMEGYCKLIVDGMLEGAGMTDHTLEKDQTVNGLPAQFLTTTLEVEGYKVLYKIAMIEGKKDFYQIMTWTLASNAEKQGPDMDAILRSFKEL